MPPTSPPHSHQLLMRQPSENKLDKEETEFAEIGKQV